MKNVANLVREEDGQGLVEYGFILVIVAVGLIVTLGALGDGLSLFYQETGDTLADL